MGHYAYLKNDLEKIEYKFNTWATKLVFSIINPAKIV
jgi:hypothetical protein